MMLVWRRWDILVRLLIIFLLRLESYVEGNDEEGGQKMKL